jgi:hypothetical protein
VFLPPIFSSSRFRTGEQAAAQAALAEALAARRVELEDEVATLAGACL